MTKAKKRIQLVIVMALVFMLGLTGCGTSGNDVKELAKVGDKVITTAELEPFASLFAYTQQYDFTEATDEEKLEYDKAILEILIDTEALNQHYEGNKEVNSSDMTQTAEDFVASVNGQEELKKELNSRGVSDETLTYFANAQSYQMAFLEEIVSDDEVETYYEENKEDYSITDARHARHILISDSEHKDENRQKIQAILDQIKSGEVSFEDAAMEHSEDGSAQNGGDLGYFGKGQMVEPFENAVYALEPGEISDIVESEFGFHIIKLEDKQDKYYMPLDEILDTVKNMMGQEKYNEEIVKIRDEVGVEYLDDAYKPAAKEDDEEADGSDDTDAVNDDADDSDAETGDDSGKADEDTE